LAMARWLVEKDGIFVGSSSAVNCGSIHSKTCALLMHSRYRRRQNSKEAWPWSSDCYSTFGLWLTTSVSILGQGRRCWWGC
jgi:hypothetical protein